MSRTGSRCGVIRAPSHDPHLLVRLLDGLSPVEVDGVAIMAPETPQVRDAIGRMKAAGLHVVALVSDQPNSERDHFVGIDDRGRRADRGRPDGPLRPPPAGGGDDRREIPMQSRDSLERRLGFDEVVAEDFPGVRALPSLETHGDPARMAQVVAAALRAHPDVAGIYSLGSGNKPLLETLRRVGRPAGLVVIAHELTPVTRRALEDREIDAVITQNVGHLVRSALRVLKAKCDRTRIFEAQERIRIEILLRENLS